MKKILAWTLISVAIIVGCAAVFVVWVVYSTEGFARSFVWELPPGYKGWVVVEFGKAGCPPLEARGISLVVPISTSGRGCTSTPLTPGWRNWWNGEYVNANGSRSKAEIASWSSVGPRRSYVRYIFYVGSDEDMKQNWKMFPIEQFDNPAEESENS